MHALGITPYFDGIFISSEHESKKPDVLFLISYSFIVISGGTVYNRISKNRMRSFSKDLFFLEKGASAERRKDHDKYNIKG